MAANTGSALPSCRADPWCDKKRRRFRRTTPLSSVGRAEGSELWETGIAAAVCLYVHFCSRLRVGSILDRGVARRSCGLLRSDLWLPIDPSALDWRAGYILRPGSLITSFLVVQRGR